MTAPRLAVSGLSKTFRNVRVLDRVGLTVLPGEVHGLAGQNGSGKSTLVKILTGYYPPDAGAHYEVDGAEMRLPVRWREVHRAGVSVVHQDLGLLDQLSVAENVCVGGFPTATGGRIDRTERDRVAERTLARLGVTLEPRRSVGSLSAAQRAEVAIARAMRDRPPQGGLVILDESTRALRGDDLRRTHGLLRRIAAGGGAVLLISHNLTELAELADRVTILRDGRVAGDGLPAAGLTEPEIARYMLGATPVAAAPRASRGATARPAGVTVTGLAGPRIGPVDLDIAAGEVVGLTGVPGSGYEDVPYLLTGAAQAKGGRLRLGGRLLDLRRASVASCIRAGVMLVPERRDRDGLAFEQNVRDNLALPALRRRGRPWFVARRWQRREADTAVRTLGIRPDNTSLLVRQLSGGNQQKVMLGKWLNLGPAFLVLHEPTQAVDVGARRDILAALHRVAASGVAILLVSSEPDDLAVACDRVLIHRPGAGFHPADTSSANALIDQIYDTAGGRRMTLSQRNHEAPRHDPAPSDPPGRDTRPEEDNPAPLAARDLAAPGPRARPAPGQVARGLASRYALLGVWLVMAVAYAAMMPGKFLAISTAQAIFGSQSALLILAIAALCTFVAGEFDLSFAGVMGLAATIIPVMSGLHHVSLWVSCAVAMAAAIGGGIVNAVFIVLLRVPSMIVTLGTASLFLGLAELISDQDTTSVSDTTFSGLAIHDVLGLPLSFYYGLILCAGFTYFLAWTPAGRHVIFVGSNREVARLAGIRVDRVRAGSFVAAAVIAGLAGILLVASVGGFDPAGTQNYLLPALAAVFLGTAVVSPGQFNPMGTFFGIFFLETGVLGLQLLGYTGWVQDAFYGAGLVLAVTIATLVRRRAVAS